MHSLKRKRSRLACTPCRERKRKCDGNEPCTTCTEWGYECYYEAQRRKSQSIEQPKPNPQNKSQIAPPDVARLDSTATDHSGLVRRREANSGAAFVRKLGLKIDPAKAPKLNLFGWNAGARMLSTELSISSAVPVVEITSLEQLKTLARVYFDKVDPCYGFIDERSFFERLHTRWDLPSKPILFDSVLAGVAALGCLFSQRNATITELSLVRTARATLDLHELSRPPCLDLLTGWTLRTIYLRMTDSPYSTWMASSTLMHLVEASGLHPEKSYDSVVPPTAQREEDVQPDIQRRLVGVAHHLNVWASFDLGLSRVSFQTNDLPLPPSPKPRDYTDEVLGLLPVSVSLDPRKSKSEIDFISMLSEILDRTHTQPPSVMAQTNLVLCIIRRIHTQNLDIPAEVAERVLGLFKKALACARSLVMDCSPWHQVANVPFQIACILLVMDMRSSLAILPEAMQTLNLVASTYDTETMREAANAAYLLVLLHQQRRKGDIPMLDEALSVHQSGRQVESPHLSNLGDEEFSWLEALVADLPGLQKVDLDQFLNTDMVDGSFMSASGQL